SAGAPLGQRQPVRGVGGRGIVESLGLETGGVHAPIRPPARRRGQARLAGPSGGSGADLGGADLVRRRVARLLEGAPHVPAGDRAVRTPALPGGEQLLRPGPVAVPAGGGPALAPPGGVAREARG